MRPKTLHSGTAAVIPMRTSCKILGAFLRLLLSTMGVTNLQVQIIPVGNSQP